MKKIKILLVDNDSEFLKTRKKILESEGYEVLTTVNSDDAKIIIDNKVVDLAIVDLRLEDDKDEADTSGLKLIKNTSSKIPKILLTAFPTVEITRRALTSYSYNIAAAADVIAKSEGPKAMLDSIARIAPKKQRLLHKFVDGLFKAIPLIKKFVK